MEKQSLGLYIHIPYCIHKCGYCDFNSHPIKHDEMDHYIDALVAEMKHYAKIYSNTNIIKTIFLGGGTPTTLSVYQLDQEVSIAEKYNQSLASQIILIRSQIRVKHIHNYTKILKSTVQIFDHSHNQPYKSNS